MIHTVEGFHVVNKAEIDVFLELSCFFDDPVDVGNLISGSSAFSKTSLNICKFLVHILLKPVLENFEHYFTSVWDECNCVVVWAFFGIAFLIARLETAISRTVIEKEAKKQLEKLLAYENANQKCQKAIAPIHETRTIIIWRLVAI